MKSRYLNIAKLILCGTLSVAFIGCSKDSAQQQRRGLVGGSASSSVFNPNGQYTRGVGLNSIACDGTIHDPNDQRSPYDAQSACADRASILAAQQAGAIPGLTQTQPVAQVQAQNIQQQQGQPGQQGQGVNPNQLPTGNPPNMSQDITTDGSGKILNRRFGLVGGEGRELVTDNCQYLNLRGLDFRRESYDPETNTLKISRFLKPNYDRFILDFNPKGELHIVAQSANGLASSRQEPIPYVLNATDQTIEVGPFMIAGPASRDFILAEKRFANEHGTAENIEDKYKLRIDGGTTDVGTGNSLNRTSSSNPGFSLGNVSNQQLDPNGGYHQLPLVPTSETPATMALNIPGFVGHISTWIAQPQHITEIYIDQIDFQSHTFVAGKPDVCEGNGSGQYLHMPLQPTQ